jgi:hypothetical protein
MFHRSAGASDPSHYVSPTHGGRGRGEAVIFEESDPMWDLMAVIAGSLVIMLLIGLVTLLFVLTDAIPKYLSNKAQRPDAVPSQPNADEAAARILGESLRRAEVSEELTDHLLAAFWAASAENRRALAHLVAGISAQGRVEDEALLRAVLRSLPDASAASYEADAKPPSSTAIRK